LMSAWCCPIILACLLPAPLFCRLAPCISCPCYLATSTACCDLAASKQSLFFFIGFVHFGARMRLVVNLGQMLKIEPRINLGGGNIGVPQHFLHRTQILRRLQYVTGKTV